MVCIMEQKRNKNEKDTIEPIEYLDKFKLNEKYKIYEGIGKTAIKKENLL